MSEITVEQKQEDRKKFIDKTDEVAESLMVMLEKEDLAVSHLSLTKAICHVLSMTAEHDKAMGVNFRNFTTQAINNMFVMKKKGDPTVVRKD